MQKLRRKTDEDVEAQGKEKGSETNSLGTSIGPYHKRFLGAYHERFFGTYHEIFLSTSAACFATTCSSLVWITNARTLELSGDMHPSPST